MEKTSRRSAFKLAAAGATTAIAATTALADEQPEEKIASSGPTKASPQDGECKISLAGIASAAAGGAGTSFVRMSPDPRPGDNTLTITGLPAGTRGITAWVTEWSASNGGSPHAGGAFFYTTSVQLFDNGRQCRVRFRMDWNSNLPAAAQVIFSS